ncbi:MarR family transcriptional regulator [Streptomyces sp. TRM 70361]|uniref:MarR family winged helix-turn-helix transcriptional regulator n=1 Tax=Streptomyces sp. TRM 70361 TaxID=3116553 RepID=UPI002E7C0175|nr:MarR family transcriptional regulator [Streptomyces sp. TRM 70361]MEE1940790.1 MarR family transcriptional regulator [Streptomyces sp. TRM 70361]
MAVQPTTRFPYLVWMLSNTLNQQIERALRPLGLTQAQLAALAQLSLESGGLSGAELGRRAGVTPQAMSASLASLEKRELVLRGPHPTHGRVIEVRITDAGRELLERAKACTEPVHERAVALLDGKEQGELRRLLLRTMAALDIPYPRDLPEGG